MTFNITTLGDQPIAPGNWGFQFVPDQLIAGQLQLVTHNVEIPGGTGILPRGTILGRQTNFTILATAGTNTGNGTVTGATPGVSPDTGAYVLTALSPTSFSVTDPEGVSLGNATVGTAFTNPEIGFTINAGSTAFVTGDSFTLTNTGTVGTVIPCVKTATDGSQTPVAVLADYVDSTNGPVRTGAYFMGEFNNRAVAFDSSWALADLTAALMPRGIHLKGSVSAADPN